MEIRLLAVGRMKAGPERDLLDRYATRLRQTGRGLGITAFEIAEIVESPARSAAERQAEEATRMLAMLQPGAFAVTLDERGDNLASRELANLVSSRLDGGVKQLVFLIGGPDGHGEAITQRANRSIAFGKATWPHQLVRVMVCEQLYRAASILSAHPYHRD